MKVKSSVTFNNVLKKYTGKCVSEHSTIIRKNYVTTVFENTTYRIRSKIGDEFRFVFRRRTLTSDISEFILRYSWLVFPRRKLF